MAELERPETAERMLVFPERSATVPGRRCSTVGPILVAHACAALRRGGQRGVLARRAWRGVFIQREEEARALAGLRFGPYAPAVARDDLAYHRQTDAGTFELRSRVQPLDRAKQFVRIGGIEA